MKRIAVFATASCLVSALVAPAALAQPGMKWRGSGGWGMGGQYARMYDAKTVETVRGEVVSIES